jgi:GxxExxY protein
MTSEVQRASSSRLLHASLTERIIGAFYQVHHELGFGFLESVYVAAFARMLTELGIRFQREVPIAVYFHGIRVGWFKADFVVESKVIVEIKAGARPDPFGEAQLLNYLRSTELEVGLILNFGPRASFKRMVFTNDRKGSTGVERTESAAGLGNDSV